MLDRSKVMREMQLISDRLFIDYSHEKEIARKVWQRMADDPDLQKKVKKADAPWIVPNSWHGKLNHTVSLKNSCDAYHVFAVDGSQVYPDRHQGTSCYVINIGTVQLCYGLPGKPAQFSSTPYLFSGADDVVDAESSPDLVDCIRKEKVLLAGLHVASTYAQQNKTPAFFLFDGSLIFWHLDSKQEALKKKFLKSYITLLHQMYERNISLAGYISLPKSKELVNLVRLALCDFVVAGCTAHTAVDHLLDRHVAEFFLHPYERTIIFESGSKISAAYPEHLKPYFCYLHVGNEIVRVEMPRWIAQDEQHVNRICQVILDQCTKGYGYPVALAEAHEQAVIKGPDRDFFYQLLYKMSLEHRSRILFSQKSMKKRRMGI